LQMLNYIENIKDIEYEISEIGEPLLEQLVLDFGIDEEKAADLFYSSKTFGKLADETTKLYQKPWTEIYEMLKIRIEKMITRTDGRQITSNFTKALMPIPL